MSSEGDRRGNSNTILVTGGCGYLGSRLIRDLARDDLLGRPTVRILDNFQSGQHSALVDLPVDGRFEFLEGDLLDPSVLRLALRGVEQVVHLAAVVRTPFSFDHPAWLEQVNHWGTNHLIEACLASQVKSVLIASSCAVYGPGGPFAESSTCRPMGPYAQSKVRSEEVALGAVERGLSVTAMRLGTLYGWAPVMRFDAVVNRLTYLAGVGRALTIYGDGEQRRPLLHIEDASSAIRYALSQHGWDAALTLNAVAESASVLEIAEAIQAAQPEVDLRFTDQDIRTHLSMVVDGTAFNRLGWRPKVSLGDGVARLVGRFRALHGAIKSGMVDAV